MISEIYKNRIKKLSGILLEGNFDKLKNFGIKDQVVSFLVSIDEKLSIFIANITLAEFAKEEKIEGDNLRELIPIIDQNDYLRFLERSLGQINYVLEWIKSPDRQEVNIKDIKDLSQAIEMANLWHNSSEATGIIKDEDGEVVKVYPKEGYYWIDLKSNNSRSEAEAMGHCGRDIKATTLYSFRDKNKSPHVTIAYDGENKKLRQVKGRGNKRPLPEYMKYVYEFLHELVEKGELNDVEWSYRKDLEDEEIGFIFEGHKDKLINSLIEKNLTLNVYSPLPFTKEDAISIIGKDAYREYIRRLMQRSLEIPSFNPTLKKGDIVESVGIEGFNNYIKELFEKSSIDHKYKINFPKSEIVKVVGEDSYNQYVHKLLDSVLEDPIEKKLEMTKDELFVLLGDVGYKNFNKTLLSNILQNRLINSESQLKYVLNRHNIPFDNDRIKFIVGPKVWFQYIKKLAMRGQSNIGVSWY